MNYFTVRQNTIKQHLGKSDTLILTLDAGKGYFYQSQSNYQIKSYTYTFKKGDTLKKILNANNFQNWTVFYSDNDKSFLFGYEENGIFYYPDWFCDEEGNWVDEYQTFTTSTVLGSIYRRFYNVTFDLNGGTYQGSTNSVKKLVPEVYYLKNFAFTPTIEGKAFWGWTLTPDGDDYVSRMPSEDITVYAKWEEADEF